MNSTIAKNIKYCHVNIDPAVSFYYDHVHIVWDQQISLHQHEELEISYIITGSGTRVIGDSVEVFAKGEVIFLPSNMPHGWSFNDYDHDETGKIENITIIFPELLLNTLQKSFPEFKESIAALKLKKQSVSLEGKTLTTVQELMKKMVQQNNIERLSSFFQLIAIIANTREAHVVGSQYRKNKVAIKMQEINRYMVNNFQKEISLEMVARHVAMNRSSFCSFFKREQGKSFFSALAEFRINCSCTMLVQTEMSIANICYAVGFNDIPHYNRTFKKQKGISPKSYRATHSKVIN